MAPDRPVDTSVRRTRIFAGTRTARQGVPRSQKGNHVTIIQFYHILGGPSPARFHRAQLACGRSPCRASPPGADKTIRRTVTASTQSPPSSGSAGNTVTRPVDEPSHPRTRYSLIFVGDAGVHTVELGTGETVRVGRGPDCEVVVRDAAVSRHHVTFYGTDPPEVEDVGSRNGTTVQGAPLAHYKRVALAGGHVVTVGATNIFVREDGGAVDQPVSASAPTVPRERAVGDGDGVLNASLRAEHLKAELLQAERERIVQALAQAKTQAAAAKLLGMSRRALIYKLEAFGIPRPRKK